MAPRYGTWKPLPEASSQQRIRPTQMIVHSIVGSARGAYGYFQNSTSIESHWITTWSGDAWQLMESDRRADANYKANRWPNGTGALSMETEDYGNPDREPWSDAQLARIIDWYRWGNETFSIPLELPDNPADPGIGYHTLFSNHWTNVAGKTCPGIVRKEQFYDLILPALAKAAAPPIKEDDMDWTSLIEAAFRHKTGPDLTAEEWGKVWFWGDVLIGKAIRNDDPWGGYQWIKANEPALK